MPGVPSVSQKTKREAAAQWAAGASMRKVAEAFGTSAQTVKRWVDEAVQAGVIEDRRGQGKPTRKPRAAKAKRQAQQAQSPAALTAPDAGSGLVVYGFEDAPTEATTRRIARNLFEGGTHQVASRAAGVPFEDYTAWMAQGVEDWQAGRRDTPHAKLWHWCDQAEAQAAQRLASVLTQAALEGGDWRAANEQLKRAHRDKGWGDRFTPKAVAEKRSDGTQEVLGFLEQVKAEQAAG